MTTSPVFVAGKGLSETDAMQRMLGEAAERDALLMRQGDADRPLMDAHGHSSGRICARRVLHCGAPGDLGSTGCSAHTQMRQAILNAVCELIERQAVLRWWQGDIPARPLTRALGQCSDVSAYLDGARDGAPLVRRTWLFRLEQPGLVHVVAACSTAPDGDQTAVAFAAGPALVATAKRALLELLSVELETADLAFARQQGHEVARDSARGLIAARQQAFRSTHRHLLDPDQDQARPDQVLPAALEQIMADCRARGQDILLADLTRSDIGLPTCRAFFKDDSLQPVFPKGFDLSPV